MCSKIYCFLNYICIILPKTILNFYFLCLDFFEVIFVKIVNINKFCMLYGSVRYAPLWKIIKYSKNLVKNEEKPCSSWIKPIFWLILISFPKIWFQVPDLSLVCRVQTNYKYAKLILTINIRSLLEFLIWHKNFITWIVPKALFYVEASSGTHSKLKMET